MKGAKRESSELEGGRFQWCGLTGEGWRECGGGGNMERCKEIANAR